MRDFLGIDLSCQTVPDATALLKFCRLLEQHQLTAALFGGINADLAERGLLLCQGALINATIIAAPPSAKNEARARDPAMHQSRRGRQWHFGLRARIGVDVHSGLVHSLHTSAANHSDLAHAHQLLHGQESGVFLNAGYSGVGKRPEVVQAQAEGGIRNDIR